MSDWRTLPSAVVLLTIRDGGIWINMCTMRSNHVLVARSYSGALVKALSNESNIMDLCFSSKITKLSDAMTKCLSNLQLHPPYFPYRMWNNDPCSSTI